MRRSAERESPGSEPTATSVGAHVESEQPRRVVIAKSPLLRSVSVVVAPAMPPVRCISIHGVLPCGDGSASGG